MNIAKARLKPDAIYVSKYCYTHTLVWEFEGEQIEGENDRATTLAGINPLCHLETHLY